MLVCLPQVVDDYSSRSFRLLAIAAGVVHGVGELDLGSMSLQHMEGWCNLHLLGLVVLTNHLRPESTATVSELQDKCVTMDAVSLFLSALGNMQLLCA